MPSRILDHLGAFKRQPTDTAGENDHRCQKGSKRRCPLSYSLKKTALKATKADPWVIRLRRRRPPLVVAVALANKTARIAWAVMLREREYQPRALAA